MGDDNKQYQAPTFAPPAPTFTPPTAPAARTTTVTGCYHHPDDQAVARCSKCGKYLCSDCVDSYGVAIGDYAGQALCYDCTAELVAQNVADLNQNKSKIRFQFILSIVGMSIGFILGIVMGISAGDVGVALLGGLIYAGVGGVFLSVVKAYFSLMWDAIKIAFSGNFGWLTVLSLIWQSIWIVLKAIFLTIKNTIDYIVYLKKTSGFIESDTQCLQDMRDYMEYTLSRSRNRGVDLDTLMQQDSTLFNNSFAQAVKSQGEAQATTNLRNSVISINERGEIIRSLAA